jgi:hypothetical protein
MEECLRFNACSKQNQLLSSQTGLFSFAYRAVSRPNLSYTPNTSETSRHLPVEATTKPLREGTNSRLVSCGRDVGL